MTQTQIRKQHTERETEVIEEVVAEKSSEADDILESTDALLDEIDDLLSQFDEQAMVNQYVQKGGQ